QDGKHVHEAASPLAMVARGARLPAVHPDRIQTTHVNARRFSDGAFFIVDIRQQQDDLHIVSIRQHESYYMNQASKLELLQGTLDLLILRTLLAGPQHGWAISERIQQISEDVLRVNQGSLYPALHRLEHQGWIKAEWGVSELGRRARFYRLTAAGRKQLAVETETWARMAGAIGRVLEMA